MIRQRIADISAYLTGIARGIHVETWIASACIISILIISIMPVSAGRSESEIYLCHLIPVIMIIGYVSVYIRRVQIRFTGIDGIVLGWYAYTMLRMWFDGTYPAAGFAIRATLMCMLYVAMRILLSGCRLSGKAIATLLIIFAITEACMGYSQIISGTSRHYLYPVTGSFLNPGPYSAYLALGTVCIFAMRKFDNISYILIMLLAIPLALTMSRAAFLAIFVCMMILFHDRINGWKQWGIIIILALSCAICLYLLKSGSANGRGIINYIGFHCILNNPLWGNGIGSFFHQYAIKTAEIIIDHPEFNLFSVDVIDCAFNDLLLVGVEQGLIGLAFATALVIVVMRMLWFVCRPLFLAALSLIIFSLFSYPFELLPFQIIVVLITSYATTISAKQTDKDNQSCKQFSLFPSIIRDIQLIATHRVD